MWALMPLWQQSAITDTVRQHFFPVASVLKGSSLFTHTRMYSGVHMHSNNSQKKKKHYPKRNQLTEMLLVT